MSRSIPVFAVANRSSPGPGFPYDEVAALLRDGVAAEDIGEFFPQVSPDAARDAYDFASYVDSYVQLPERAA
jgi:uncharacterized protein (DUF433 family)